jgi:hypothetical protein
VYRCSITFVGEPDRCEHLNALLLRCADLIAMSNFVAHQAARHDELACLEDIFGRAVSLFPHCLAFAVVLLTLSSVDVIERSVGGSPAGSSRSGAYRRSKTH